MFPYPSFQLSNSLSMFPCPSFQSMTSYLRRETNNYLCKSSFLWFVSSYLFSLSHIMSIVYEVWSEYRDHTCFFMHYHLPGPEDAV